MFTFRDSNWLESELSIFDLRTKAFKNVDICMLVFFQLANSKSFTIATNYCVDIISFAALNPPPPSCSHMFRRWWCLQMVLLLLHRQMYNVQWSQWEAGKWNERWDLTRVSDNTVRQSCKKKLSQNWKGWEQRLRERQDMKTELWGEKQHWTNSRLMWLEEID